MKIAAPINLIGKEFERLKVIERAENTISGKARWRCECKCGGKTVVIGSDLRSGHVKSCGCLWEESAKNAVTKHGDAETKLYAIYKSIIYRTSNTTNNRAADYVGRGITVCDEWKNDYAAFKEWALASGYKAGLTIDRKNNDEGYSPENCRWADAIVQANNKRNNHLLTYNSETKTLAEWARETEINYFTLKTRINRGWSAERALTEPTKK